MTFFRAIYIFHKLIILVTGLFLGNILSGVCQYQTKDSDIVVMSFNVRYINTKDGVNIWANRKEKVAQVISSNNVDIAGLQEPWLDQIKDLQGLLPEYAWFGWGRDQGNDEGEFCPIFYKKNVLTALDSGIFWISRTPEIAGSKGWDVKYPRMVVWGRFKEKDGDREFLFFNTHLGGEIARSEGAKLIRTKIDEMSNGLPVIVTGDYNSKPDSEAYAIMVSDHNEVAMNDAFMTAQKKNDEQYTDYWFDGENKDLKRIDYIFVSHKINVLYHEIINKRMGRFYPSDHLAIRAIIEW